MKKIILSLLLVLATLGANAQGFGGRQMNPEDMAKRQAERIKEACGINDDQYKAIYEYFLDSSKKQIAQMDSIRNAGGQGGFPRMSREDMEKRRQAQTDKIKSILTEEQFAKYEEMQKQMMQRFGQGRGNGEGRRNRQQ